MTSETQSQKRLRVLITSPSLSESDNISGISTIVRQIVKHCDCEFVHFAAGKKDNDRAGLNWLLKQTVLPFRFLWTILRQNVDAVHINTAFSPPALLRDFVLTRAAKLVGRPVLLRPHGGRYLLKEIPGTALHWITGKMLSSANRVLVLSEREKDRLQARWKTERIEVLANAIDTEEIEFREKPNQTRNIIFFGRIDRDKGLREIADACRILDAEGFEFTFTCCGTGPDADSFVVEMNSVLGDRFEYRGVVSGPEKWSALANADIFLLPSYFEGLPLSMLEAMAAKCVVIATDVGSIRTVIKHGVNGFLVQPHNTEQVVQELRVLLADGTNMVAIRDNARETVERDFSIHKYVVELIRVYGAIVK